MGGPLVGADPAGGLTVPEGNPEGLQSASQKLLAAADAMTTHEYKILRAGHVPSWVGSASTAYTATVNQTCAAYANQSSDACKRAASAVRTLAHALKAAQEQAREAIARLNAMVGDAQSISAQYDSLSALEPEAQQGRVKMLGMMVAEFNAEVAALRAQVADAHTQAREAAAVAAGSFGDAAGMAPSIVARRTERILTQVASGNYSGLERIGDADYLSVRAQEEIAGSLADDVTRNLNEGEGLGEFKDLSAVVGRFRFDEEFSTAFYNSMGGVEAGTINRDAVFWYSDDEGFDDPALIDLIAPFAVMLGTATRSGELRKDFTDDFLQRDLPFKERDHLGIGKFLMSNGEHTRFGAGFLSEAAQDLVVEQDPMAMDGNNPYIAPPVEILGLVANNPEASGLLLTGKTSDGFDNLSQLLMRSPYWPDEGEAFGDVIYAGAHTLRFYGDDGLELANQVAGRVIVTVPEFSDHLANGVKPALVTVFDDHVVDFEYAAMERSMPGLMDGDVEVRMTYDQGSEYLEVLFGDDAMREGTSRIIGERVALDIHIAARNDDTEYANRAGALAEMGVLSAGEADLDAAEAEATANSLKQFAAGKLLDLTPAKKVPLLSDAANLTFEKMFPTDQVEKALEEQGAVQVDKLQSLNTVVIATKVELGQLPPQAMDIVDPIDGSVNPNFLGGRGDDDTLRWDLDGDGIAEVVTERDVYDASGHDLSASAYAGALNLADSGYSEAHPPKLDEVPLPDGYSQGNGIEQDPNAWDYIWDGLIDEGVVDGSSGYVVATEDDLEWDPVEHVYRLTLKDPDDPDVTIAFKRSVGDEWVRVEKRGDDWVPVGD
ncbi:MAG: PspA/IM30 family protein [Actinomycetota bacterium]